LPQPGELGAGFTRVLIEGADRLEKEESMNQAALRWLSGWLSDR
jgi:hypothetical protein